MVKEEIREKISNAGYYDSLVYDNPSFDNSIIGVDENGKVVYDYDMMATEFVEEGGKESIEEYRKQLPIGEEMTDEDIFNELRIEAFEFIDYNTIRATPYMGCFAPVVVCDMEYMGEEYEGGTKYQNMINGEPYTSEIVYRIKNNNN